MKKWFMDRLEIFLTISICIVLVWMNIILFIPKIQKQENNVIENQIEYNDNSINRFDNTLSSRSGESRKIIIYKSIKFLKMRIIINIKSYFCTKIIYFFNVIKVKYIINKF